MLAPRLDIRQSQQLVMTPQLQQAIKLLQFNNLEVAAYVEQELERNPLLERADGDDEADSAVSEALEADAAQAGVDGANGAETAHLVEPVAGQADAPLDVEDDNTWTNDSPTDAGTAEAPAQADGGFDTAFDDWGGGGRRDFDDEMPGLEQTVSGATTLREHLESQVNMTFPDPGDRLIASRLVELLDEAGYVAGALDAVAEQLNCPVAQVEAVLERCQQFDPAGLFARDLPECLALQLADRDRLDPAMRTLLDNLDLLGRHDYQTLARRCGVDSEDLADMVAEVRSLDPKPALAFGGESAQPVAPDVLMRPDPASGGWAVELNPHTLPRVLVNNTYYAEVSGNASGDARQYLNEQLQSANWLVKALHQRAQTILKVASELVRQQDAFFRHGVQALKPLILRDIAEAVDLHESTVSRVTANKYILTPRGIYELKYFFTQAVAGADGESHSAESVRHRIRTLIDDEAPDSVLSDDRLVAILKSEGIDVARRTVAKYRESMNIPSSVKRKRQKRLRA